ncbi:MAG: hypothetical protein ACI3ZN_10465 [Candidatus Cryptobacteroides sp.]
MKRFALIFAAFAAMFLSVTACGSLAGSTSTSAAYTNGQTTGTALKAIYTQYKADGNKLNMSNVSNLLNLATLANSLQGLKGQASGTAFYTDFAKGLVAGSTNLVNTNNTSSVMNGLANLTNLDLSSLAGLAGSASSSETVSKGVETVKNAGEIASSVSNILNLFK